MSNESFCERPWGTWLVLAMQPGYKVKKLTLEPGKAMSKQYHTHRDEYWVVLSGSGKLYLDYSKNTDEDSPLAKDFTLNIHKGFFVKIEKGVIHKVCNDGDETLTIIETQVGDITEEGDIVRLD